MKGWWKRDRFFQAYMAREATAVIVYLYGLLLVAGIVALARGEAAYAAWIAFLGHPVVVLFQVLALLVFLYHTWSWFRIMPKTMPPLHVGGRRVPGSAITAAGLAAAAAASIAVAAFIAFA
jgi:fumarate reductase subunit C